MISGSIYFHIGKKYTGYHSGKHFYYRGTIMPFGFQSVPGIPFETFEAARKVFNIQHIYIRIGDNLESILAGTDLINLDPTAAKNSEAVFRLALVTAFQWAESLPDPLAADATLHRMDWKYALYLPMNYAGITAAALCNFRDNLISNPRGLDAFARLLENLEKLGLYPRGASGKTDPSALLISICQFTRFYEMKQSMKATLGALSSLAPDWMRAHALPHWYERYKTGGLKLPAGSDLPREALSIGIDARQLLSIIKLSDDQHLNDLTEVSTLGRLFEEQYHQEGDVLHRLLPSCSACANHHQDRLMK